MVVFFLFKQKTAYDMRISDWSSDVCSSDLFLSAGNGHAVAAFVEGVERVREIAFPTEIGKDGERRRDRFDDGRCAGEIANPADAHDPALAGQAEPGRFGPGGAAAAAGEDAAFGRSEEHTSELQSLMRISYAVYCLIKRKPTTREQTKRHQ